MDGRIIPSDFLPGSPFRRPSWRWLRASHLLAAGKDFDHRPDDLWVARAWRFQFDQKRLEQCKRPRRTGRPDTVVADALRFRREERPERRDQLEAYLLTDEPFAAVAAHTSLSDATVEAYHQLFFAARDHLRATDWIMAQAVGGDWWLGFPDRGSIWKFIAYTAGARALEAVIAISTDQPLPAWLSPSSQDHPAYAEARLRNCFKNSAYNGS